MFVFLSVCVGYCMPSVKYSTNEMCIFRRFKFSFRCWASFLFSKELLLQSWFQSQYGVYARICNQGEPLVPVSLNLKSIFLSTKLNWRKENVFFFHLTRSIFRSIWFSLCCTRFVPAIWYLRKWDVQLFCHFCYRMWKSALKWCLSNVTKKKTKRIKLNYLFTNTWS